MGGGGRGACVGCGAREWRVGCGARVGCVGCGARSGRRARGALVVSGRAAVVAVVLEVVGVGGERRAQPVQVPAGALDVAVEEYLHNKFSFTVSSGYIDNF